MAFELYEGGRSTSDAEEVTILQNGTIVLSPEIGKRHLDGIEWIETYYDKEAKKIGIKPVRKSTGHAYKLVRPKNSKRLTFSGRGFLGYYKLFIDPKGMEDKPFLKVTVPAVFKDGMIVFDGSKR